jgi:hypothetical protein
MRKIGGTLLAVAIAVVGVVGLIAFFNSRDSSTTTSSATETTATTSAGGKDTGLVAAGNVVLRFSDRSFAPRLRALAADLGAPDSPALREAGQAVVLQPDARTGGVAAQAYGHDLTVRTPGDPELRAFVERWLGQGAR